MLTSRLLLGARSQAPEGVPQPRCTLGRALVIRSASRRRSSPPSPVNPAHAAVFLRSPPPAPRAVPPLPHFLPSSPLFAEPRRAEPGTIPFRTRCLLFHPRGSRPLDTFPSPRGGRGRSRRREFADLTGPDRRKEAELLGLTASLVSVAVCSSHEEKSDFTSGSCWDWNLCNTRAVGNLFSVLFVVSPRLMLRLLDANVAHFGMLLLGLL